MTTLLSFLPGKSHRQRRVAVEGGRKESDTTEHSEERKW